jgi:hypothetical protein
MVPAENDAGTLDSFHPAERLDALRRLARGAAFPPAGHNVNLHFHSFFSYNAQGWSPAHIAWEARRAGLHAAALCDFDVLDGLEEFYTAGAMVGLRVAVHLETRAYLATFADKEISSPGEPGVTYIMGAGFGRAPTAGTPQAETLAGLRAQARARNVALMERINPRLAQVALDYEKDVLPLTPSGNATERHIIRAYVSKARQAFPSPAPLAAFWAKVLGLDHAAVAKLLGHLPSLEEVIRAKLIKRGGVGYVQPSPQSFPTVESFTAWARSCGAIPMITWLDGTSAGEADPKALLDALEERGCLALNIIPDRNWNLKDPAAAALKRAKLAQIIAAAEARALPLNIGTEMNKLGLPFVDELGGEVLEQYREPFLRGARVMVGHAVLTRYAKFSYAGPEADAEFKDRAARNRFFESVGALPPLTENVARKLGELGPARAMSALRDAAPCGKYRV